jgi:hypothetical protein
MINAPMDRRRLLSSGSVGLLSLFAGCTSFTNSESSGESSVSSEQEDSGNNSTTTSEKLNIKTGSVEAESLNSTILSGELVSLGRHDLVNTAIQIRAESWDSWYRTGDLLRFDSHREPGTFEWEYSRSLMGGIEYRYRCVAKADNDLYYSDEKSFDVQDLSIDTANIAFDSGELVDKDYSVAEFSVINQGDVGSGRITVEAKWLDESDVQIGTSLARLQTLMPGEEGIISLPADGTDPSNIYDFELIESKYRIVPPDTSRVEIQSASIENERLIGVATHSLEDKRQVTFVIRFKRGELIIGDLKREKNIDDIGTGQKFQYEISLDREGLSLVSRSDDYEVIARVS